MFVSVINSYIFLFFIDPVIQIVPLSPVFINSDCIICQMAKAPMFHQLTVLSKRLNHSLIQLWLWQVEGWQLIILGALIGFLSF